MKTTISIAALLLAAVSIAAEADELIKMVEQDLARLGYAPGPVDGEETVDTTVAITKFQAANGMDITGEVTPELARALMAAQPADTGATTAIAAAPAAAAASASPPAPDPAALPILRPILLDRFDLNRAIWAARRYFRTSRRRGSISRHDMNMSMA